MTRIANTALSGGGNDKAEPGVDRVVAGAYQRYGHCYSEVRGAQLGGNDKAEPGVDRVVAGAYQRYGHCYSEVRGA